jgi:hypothetical protein
MVIDFQPAEKFRGTQIYRQANNLAYAYETSFKAVDADGAPNAYHPDDTGLDRLANAGYPHTNWWQDVLVPDPAHSTHAYQQPDGQFAGYFVAMTSLRKPNGDKLDPATYVDATRFPYVVIPTGFGAPSAYRQTRRRRFRDPSGQRHYDNLHHRRFRRRSGCKTRGRLDCPFRVPGRTRAESEDWIRRAGR